MSAWSRLAIGRLPPDRQPWAFGAVVGSATLGLLAVCWRKGDRPGWRRREG